MDNGMEKEKSMAAKQRWKLLACALRNQSRNDQTEFSVRNFTGFDIFEREIDSLTTQDSEVNAKWITYKSKTSKNWKTILVRILPQKVSAENLIGFNNTGNVCVWPSEEVLAYYCLKRRDLFLNSNVIELGCGMTGLAGLFLASNVSVNKLLLTDGNERSVTNVKAVIKRNEIESVSSCVLQWKSEFNEDQQYLHQGYDVVICADCLFFVELQEALLKTILFLLKDEGICILMAPQRSGSLQKFTTKANDQFSVTVEEKYDELLWEKHQNLLQNSPTYNPNLHYPILITLKRK